MDLDLQVSEIDNYQFTDTEEVFYNLYYQSKVNEVNAIHYRIWVTGLIHKEAYFLIPDLQELFNNFSHYPNYNGKALVLKDIYIDMADKICTDPDLISNFQRASNRINHCSGLNCSEIDKLKDSWKKEFSSTLDNQHKNDLVFALLTIKKAKDYWNSIYPSNQWTRSAQVFREQLLLAIGRFYSEQSHNAK